VSTPVTDMSGHSAGSLGEQLNHYFRRLKGGEMGSLPAVLALVILGVLFSTLNEFFLTKLNFANLFVQAAELTVLASALVFLLILTEIDLSAGVTGGVGMAALTLLMKDANWGLVPAVLVALAIGMATGMAIGFIVAKIGVPAFVVSLGFFLGYQGLQLVMLGDGGIFRVENPTIKAIMNQNLPAWAGWVLLIVSVAASVLLTIWDRSRRSKAGLLNGPILFVITKLSLLVVSGAVAVYVLNQNRSKSVRPILGVPKVVPLVLGILFVGTLVLDRTRFGRHLYAVGGNPEAARRAGINVARIRISGFMICSSLAVVSGILHASRVGSVESTAGRQIVLSGVAAAVVGGVSLFGGRGRLANAAIGALAIAMIDNGLGLLGLPGGINFLVTGGVLVLAATVDALARKRNAAQRR
jgi:D-xylose transport system permease protein